jgi:hypothetical protein
VVMVAAATSLQVNMAGMTTTFGAVVVTTGGLTVSGTTQITGKLSTSGKLSTAANFAVSARRCSYQSCCDSLSCRGIRIAWRACRALVFLPWYCWRGDACTCMQCGPLAL